jgi:prepilin-type N-terminal cleavage/methylation domain-containing protein
VSSRAANRQRPGDPVTILGTKLVAAGADQIRLPWKFNDLCRLPPWPRRWLETCSQASGDMGSNGQKRAARGFTLIELMAVVIIVGILAVVGLVGYRRFITSARTSEAIYMVGSIRSAQESYRAETLQYLSVSTSIATYYPNTNPVRQHGDLPKSAWDNPGHSDYANWRQLGARSDGPVVYGYATVAGAAGTAPPALSIKEQPGFGTPAEPWYVIQAGADLDGNGIWSYVVGSSFTSEIYVENEGE